MKIRDCERCGDPCYFPRVKCREPGCGLRICQGCRALRETPDEGEGTYKLLARCADHGDLEGVK